MPQATQSLQHRQVALAQASEQLRILQTPMALDQSVLPHGTGLEQLRACEVRVLQVNLGKLCNMTCRHCHVDAGPDRRESMTRETVDLCLDVIRRGGITTLDLTGGAPEMNPHFRYFVEQARKFGVDIVDRCNLTILLAPGYDDLPEFLAEHEVEIVASLPCYLPDNTDRQRGDGAYQQSIAALRRLNAVGYGASETSSGRGSSRRTLTLVFNPVGPTLPPSQLQLEQQYRDYLRRTHGIEFNRLYTITNMPISRFLEELVESGQYEAYMQKLLDAFNPAAAERVMCRTMVSVGWDGSLYDCDFNQMLELPTSQGTPRHIRDFDWQALSERPIVVGRHCLGCTAGSGSSCQGAIA